MPYIDQQSAVDVVKEVIGNLDHECKPMMDFYSAIWNIPAADVAPVVRCRECQHAKGNKETVTVFCSAFMRDMRGHDFCSYGKKSTDNSTDL